jgi:hypothetical protein
MSGRGVVGQRDAGPASEIGDLLAERARSQSLRE